MLFVFNILADFTSFIDGYIIASLVLLYVLTLVIDLRLLDSFRH